jgi:DNA polymerase (family 10)
MNGSVTNSNIAMTFEEVAALLEQQAASAHRVRAWRAAAQEIRESDRQMADVFRNHGRVGLEAVPHIGPRLASVIIELLTTGRCGALDRLHGDATAVLAGVPGIGSTLATRIHSELGIETLHELEAAAHDGRLARVAGFGPRRVQVVREVLATRLARRKPDAPSSARPPVALLLEVDAAYRRAAAVGELVRIAPRRFNSAGASWLPVMHLDRDDWSFTAMFSNTALAHQRGRTGDWVILYFHLPHQAEGQATVVTEWQGRLRGCRVVRGRERESLDHYAATANAGSKAA